MKVKAEPMEVDPAPAERTPPASHLLVFSTLGASEKSEPMPETLARPQKDLFSQDISVKMASELLFKLSGMLFPDIYTLSGRRGSLGNGRCAAHIAHGQQHVFLPCSIAV